MKYKYSIGDKVQYETWKEDEVECPTCGHEHYENGRTEMRVSKIKKQTNGTGYYIAPTYSVKKDVKIVDGKTVYTPHSPAYIPQSEIVMYVLEDGTSHQEKELRKA